MKSCLLIDLLPPPSFLTVVEKIVLFHTPCSSFYFCIFFPFLCICCTRLFPLLVKHRKQSVFPFVLNPDSCLSRGLATLLKPSFPCYLSDPLQTFSLHLGPVIQVMSKYLTLLFSHVSLFPLYEKREILTWTLLIFYLWSRYCLFLHLHFMLLVGYPFTFSLHLSDHYPCFTLLCFTYLPQPSLPSTATQLSWVENTSNGTRKYWS